MATAAAGPGARRAATARAAGERRDVLTRAIDARLQEIEQRLGGNLGNVAELVPGAALVGLTNDRVSERAGRRLPFYPRVASEAAPDFSRVEAIEFRDRDVRRAEAMYRRLADTKDSRLRAAALVGQARALRRDNRLDEALALYESLAELDAAMVAGAPAELVARRERLVLFAQAGRAAEAER